MLNHHSVVCFSRGYGWESLTYLHCIRLCVYVAVIVLQEGWRFVNAALRSDCLFTRHAQEILASTTIVNPRTTTTPTNSNSNSNNTAMGRLHSNGKGISASALPYSRSVPTWYVHSPLPPAPPGTGHHRHRRGRRQYESNEPPTGSRPRRTK